MKNTEMRLIDANDLKNEMLEETPYIHLGPFGYCACSPKTGGELVFKREDVLRAIDSAPTVDAVEVVHGRWIVKGQDVFCSHCNKESGYNRWGASAFSGYCPNCGAKMAQE